MAVQPCMEWILFKKKNKRKHTQNVSNFYYEERAAKKHHYYVIGGSTDIDVAVFRETSVGFLKGVALQLAPKYSQS